MQYSQMHVHHEFVVMHTCVQNNRTLIKCGTVLFAAFKVKRSILGSGEVFWL